MVQENIVNNVHEWRTRTNVTQEELARVVGVTRQTIIAIEKGNYAPSVLLAIKIARYFKRPLEEILQYIHEK